MPHLLLVMSLLDKLAVGIDGINAIMAAIRKISVRCRKPRSGGIG